jgi:hypothetical protein
MISTHLPKLALVLAAVSLVVALSSCSNDIEDAMSEGCEALPQMADAYASGDRATFDEVNGQAMRVGFAEFRAADFTNDESLIADASVANLAYSTLYSAAYEPAEANNGRSVWRGRDLTPSQQQDVDAGLAVCVHY